MIGLHSKSLKIRHIIIYGVREELRADTDEVAMIYP